MEEHFLRECKLHSSWWYSICQNYLQLNTILNINHLVRLSEVVTDVTRDTWPRLWCCLLLTLLESSKLREVSHDVCTLQPLQANWECLAACVESPCQTSHFPQSSAGRPKQGCKLYSENSRQHCRQGKYSATPLSCLRSKESLLHNTIYLFWTNSRETFVFFNG